MLSRLNEPFENSEEFRFPEAAIRSPDACKQFHRNEKISGSVRLADALSDLRFQIPERIFLWGESGKARIFCRKRSCTRAEKMV